MTNKTYAELLAQGGGGASAGGWSRAIFTTGTITFAEAGTVVLSAVGAAGGGAGANSASGAATGGNSAPWGRKKIKVSAGDTLEITIGAGGARAAANANNGSPGGTTTVKLNAVTIMTIQGSEGGVYAAGTATATASTPVAKVTGADYWVAGIQAGSAQATSNASSTGGAAVDIFGNSTGRSPNISGAGASGVGGSIGTNLGGVPIPWIALADFGFVVTDGSLVTTIVGIPGRGGQVSTAAAGALAGGGGGGGVSQGTGGKGGGGGGGGTSLLSGPGGDAYAYITFTPAE